MGRVSDVERIVAGAEFGAEFALANQVELFGECVVCMLQHLDFGAVQIVARVKLGRGAGSESEGFDASSRGSLDRVGDDVLDNAVG